MKKTFRRRFFVGLAVLAVCAMFLAAQTPPKKFRVGAYDSRAVAVSYARSAMFAPYMQEFKAKYEKAKAEKDEKTIKECEAEGPAMQEILHQQGFSIASVADILEKVKADLAKVAQQAGVDMIVSKWEVVQQGPAVEIVDVTADLVKLFKPDGTTLKILDEMSKQPPIPLLTLMMMPEK
ncbi:MAG: hypothetical protein A2W03_04420 [Candidatus Aminicenantes bacterium RBG_16_63_16]|nr:MAG: hypothetical protein A2W03_04420 [Candidatus Aminicenantes bacterium RBG_16_63_16]